MRFRNALRWTPLSLVLVALSTPGTAAPTRGEPFPSTSAKDLSGQVHPNVLREGVPHLVVAMTDRDAAEETQAWFDAANERLPQDVRRISLISLKLPFFVSDGMVRKRARERVPQASWRDSFLDKDGTLARDLDLPKSEEPYVFVVDADGRVTARAHGSPNGPGADAIWQALGATG